MDAKIKTILLWPNNPANKVRRIEFRCKGVEVISGWSEKGKSSIIHIIDYCLGSEKCLIPIGEVRDQVSWFGVVVVCPNGRKILCARKNPGAQQDSSDMCFLEGRRLLIPELPTKTHSRDAVIAALDELAGLPARGNRDEEGSDFDGPPSFRDMAAFNFQPQHIIANPNTLFFKADTWTHREKLIRSVLPYVFGAVDARTLDLQVRLRGTEAKLKAKREELEFKRQALIRVHSELRGHFRTAQKFDLIGSDSTPDETWTTTAFIGALRTAQEVWRKSPKIPPVSGATRKVRAEMAALNRKLERLIKERDDAERQLEKIQRVSASVSDFTSGLDTQMERVSPVGWLGKRLENGGICPLCDRSELSPDEFSPLVEVTQRLSNAIATAAKGAPVLTLEARKLEAQIEDIDLLINDIESQVADWEARSEELKELGSRRDFINSFIGRLDAELTTAESSGIGELEKEVDDYEKQAKDLRAQVDPETIRQKMDSALREISDKIGFYAKLMGVGHANQRWFVDEKNLTLVTRGHGRTDHLWEIGSAANWMGYHVAAILAMHEFFRHVDHNPVPKFIVFDQPSQAYFPEGVGRKRGKVKDDAQMTRPDDVSRLKRLFRALSESIERTEFGLQIILLEHAEPSMWKGIPYFSMPDKIEWREKGALIPEEWR